MVTQGRSKYYAQRGARIITYLYIETETVYLLTIYDKGEKSELKPNELADMIDSLELDI